MRIKRLQASMLAAALFGALLVPLTVATSASAHGWVTDPPSRQDNCSTGQTSFDCGQIKYEPQSVEAPKGSLQCSGGNAAYPILDDDTKPWPVTDIPSTVTVNWKITAQHATSSWEYFVDGQPFVTFDYAGQKPPATLSHTLNGLPEGKHLILARWNVADTVNAFYSCLDVNVTDAAGTPTPTPTPTATTTPDPTPGDGATCAAAWHDGTIYNTGDTVTQDGHTWRAQWWTMGEKPGTTGQWGVWQDQGACGDTTDPAPDPTPTTDPTPTPDPTQTATPTPTPTETATPDPTPTTDPVPGTECTDPWNATAVYTGGQTVSDSGHIWKAQWWTQGQQPGTDAVWQDQGACATGPADGNGDGTTDPGDGSTDPVIPDPPANPGASGQKAVAYFTDWGIYQRDYQVKDIETSGSAADLTHIMYAFGNVQNGTCTVGDSYADYEKTFTADESVSGVADVWDQPLAGNFNQLLELKKLHPNLKVLWSFGGWTWSGGFTQAAANPAAFADSCYSLIHDARWDGLFDGIDIDWEYPNACGLTCDESGAAAYPALMKALRQRFGDELVTSAISADGTDGGKIDLGGYADAAASVDFFDPMTYDYFGAWDKTGPTAPHSPLTSYAGMPINGFDTTTTINKLLQLGVPGDKLLLGIGFYGRGWTGVTQAAPGGSATGAAAGTYEAGIEDYNVLKQKCPTTGTVAGTAYAFCNGEWWSYDTPATIKDKMDFVKQWGLGGAFAWSLDGDTADGELMSAIHDGLAS